jgi:hypothetical protein
MVLGDYLIDALSRLTHHVSKLNGVLDTVIMAQNQYNLQLQEHFHIVPPFGPTIMVGNIPLRVSNMQTSIKLLKGKFSLMTNKANLELFKANYLTAAGDGWILSRANNVN